MKIKVTEKGLIIPKELLGNSEEVEITQLENQIIINNVNNNISQVNDSKMSILDSGNDQNCYDLAMKLGIIGIAKDLPSDLSTNPNYFEGYRIRGNKSLIIIP